MQQRTFSLDDQSVFLESLTNIGKSLSISTPPDSDNFEPLIILCDCLCLDAAAFYILKEDEDKISEFYRYGHYERKKMAKPINFSFFVQNQAITGLNLAGVEFCQSDRDTSEKSLALFPVKLNGRLSAVIAVKKLENKEFTHEVERYMRAVTATFELYLSKLNEMKKVEDLINFIPNPVMGLDAEGAVNVWNPATVKMTGWSKERILGKGNQEIALPFYGIRRPTAPYLVLHPDSEWEATYIEYRKEKDVVHSLNRIQGITGGETLVTSATKRIRDINGRVSGSLHFVRDVTREHLIESRLQSSESMFKTMADYAGLGFSLFRDNNSLYFNEKFRELVGVTGQDIKLNDVINCIGPKEREDIQNRISLISEGECEGPLRLEFNVTIGESNRFYSGYAQILDYEDLPALFFLIDDITEKKELSERVRANELKMYHEGRLTSLGIMAAGIAHELNQPLNTIRVMAEGILFGRDEGWKLEEQEVYESMKMVSKQVCRMADVIQNIRNFSRDDYEIKFCNVDCNLAIENVLSMIGRQFEAHEISIKKELLEVIPSISGNLNRIEQVIMNLMVNAKQAFEAYSRNDKCIWIKTGSESNNIHIEVTDNASGIPENIIEKIFDPFFTTKEFGKGTGLGLTISRAIVKDFKGEIHAINNEYGGATFKMLFPIAGG